MPDVRERLYESYRTDFKAHGANHDPARFAVATEAHYGGWLDSADRDAPVLELGCGEGHLVRELQRRGFRQVEGVDIAPEQVAAARERGLPVREQDAFEALEEPRTYGLVVAIDLIEHLELEDMLRLLALTRERLAPRGGLLLTTANGQGLFPGQVIYGDLTHRTILNPGSLAHALRVAGFSDIDIREVGPPPDRRLRQWAWRTVRLAATGIRLAETGKRQDVWTETMACFAR
jgi:2-polyprenyl-3-methyl-5-hydroxy-6-metoxy-1,4-benzoquinol methylase